MKGKVTQLPHTAPEIGKKFLHYKGDCYEVVALALHSNDDEWMVVYKPLYEKPDVDLFTRPLREWFQKVEWKGKQVARFSSV